MNSPPTVAIRLPSGIEAATRPTTEETLLPDIAPDASTPTRAPDRRRRGSDPPFSGPVGSETDESSARIALDIKPEWVDALRRSSFPSTDWVIMMIENRIGRRFAVAAALTAAVGLSSLTAACGSSGHENKPSTTTVTTTVTPPSATPTTPAQPPAEPGGPGGSAGPGGVTTNAPGGAGAGAGPGGASAGVPGAGASAGPGGAGACAGGVCVGTPPAP